MRAPHRIMNNKHCVAKNLKKLQILMFDAVFARGLDVQKTGHKQK